MDNHIHLLIHLSDDELATLIYIHNNPVKANMCRYASEYRWSSINTYLGAKNPLINVSFAYNIAGSKDSLLHYFAKEADTPDNSLFKNDHRETNHFFTDEKALDVLPRPPGPFTLYPPVLFPSSFPCALYTFFRLQHQRWL